MEGSAKSDGLRDSRGRPIRKLQTSIIAVDPGEMSGWAGINRKGEFASGEESFARCIEYIEQTVEYYRVSQGRLVLAVERPNVPSRGGRGSLKNAMWEIETTGCMRHFARKHHFRFHEVNRSDALYVAQDANLKAVRWWSPGHEHANDAARVLAHVVSAVESSYWKRLVVDSGLLQQ